MAFEKMEVLENQEITPEVIVAKIRGMIDEAARVVLDKRVKKLVTWVKERISNLEAEDNPKIDRVELGLNAYNRTDGLGIQSVAVGFRSGREVRLSRGDKKDPTIGVVAKGLVEEDAPWATVKFPVAEGEIEMIYPDDRLRFDDNDKYGKIPQRGAPVVFVNGPKKTRTIAQVSGDVTPESVVGIQNEGVYVCEYA